ncbi:hypothetical protein B5C34_01360 [Pacificimonas flava]|uniref:Divergent polysaccharide deacetylase family protein n=2 Tax=Pacificimonas TaxID=1960290 RepID=A0A219B331_9SPHN|nr:MULTISPECIES: divergent polysaccharide deacetylase family protein [Pacificimonas]MBZ6378136.1 divergent polysaccharide deacetylase family protein [Pacificimonas aurantium]OWV32229.1 hypothetical protein B5C34_01360 [Pacificimonas flava]
MKFVGLTLLAAVVVAASAWLAALAFAGLPETKAVRAAQQQAALSSLARSDAVLAAEESAAAAAQSRTERPPAGESSAPLPEGPLVAILVTEIGMQPIRDAQLIPTLPPEVSLAFSPYGENLARLVELTRDHGHEVIVSLPMEPNSYPDISPGPGTLRTDVSAEDNLAAVEQVLGRFPEVDGVTGMMGSRFTRSREALGPLMIDLSARELAFIDQRASASSIAEAEARAAGVASRTNDLFLDEPAERELIDRRLAQLSEIAKRRGYAIGYARALPVTAEALADYAETAEERGVSLVGAVRLVRNLPPEG